MSSCSVRPQLLRPRERARAQRGERDVHPEDLRAQPAQGRHYVLNGQHAVEPLGVVAQIGMQEVAGRVQSAAASERGELRRTFACR